MHDKVENRAINKKDHVFLSAPNSTDADKREVHAYLIISGMREKRRYGRRGR